MGLQLIMTKTDDCVDEVHYGLVDFSEVKSEYSLKLLQLEINPEVASGQCTHQRATL